MIVNKPQFDTDKIKPGMFVMFRKRESWRGSFDRFESWNKGFIVFVEPFKIKVLYFKPKTDDNNGSQSHIILLQEKLNKEVEIYFPELVKVKSGHNPLTEFAIYEEYYTEGMVTTDEQGSKAY
jgi:hypothetical protein